MVLIYLIVSVKPWTIWATWQTIREFYG